MPELKEELKTALNILVDGMYQRHDIQYYEIIHEIKDVLNEMNRERAQEHAVWTIVYPEG